MKMHFGLIAAIISLGGLAGCTTSLKTEQVTLGSKPGRGILYNLPRAAFDVEAKFLITDCVKKGDKGAEISYELVSAKVEHKLVGDPAQTYRVRYDKLNSPLKITSAAVLTHPNGMIKSFNVEQDDRTAQVMTSLAASAINLYKASSTFAVGVASGVAVAKVPCDLAIAQRLDERKKLLDSLPPLRQADESLATDVLAADKLAAASQLASARLAEAEKGKNPSEVAQAQAESKKLQAQWKVAYAKLAGRTKAAPIAQAKIDKLSSVLTATVLLQDWSPTPQKVCGALEMEQAEFLRQLGVSLGEAISLLPTQDRMFSAQACVTGPTSAGQSVAAGAQSSDLPKAGEAAGEQDFEGIVYQLPQLGGVTVTSGATKLVGLRSVVIPQFGAKAILWLENKPFDQNSLQAAFNEDGSLGSATFKALVASAERGAAALADTTKSLVELMQLRANAALAKSNAASEEQKKEHQRQLDALDQQIALLNKRKDLETARAPSTNALDREKERLTKEIDVETLRQEYEALKKKGAES